MRDPKYGGYPAGVIDDIFRDAILHPRKPENAQITTYDEILEDLDAAVVQRFAAYVTGGIMQEHRAFSGDELMLRALYSNAKKVSDGAGFVGSLKQSPWTFFMRHGSNDMITAMIKGWRDFEEDANARPMRNRMDEVLEHDLNWVLLGDYVRTQLLGLKQNAPWQHPTGMQSFTALYRGKIDRNEMKARMVQKGLRRGKASGSSSTGVMGFLY